MLIIVCGSAGMINPAYLTIARMTGGTVHTMEADLTEEMKAAEGTEIEIQGQRYEIRGGEFYPLVGM